MTLADGPIGELRARCASGDMFDAPTMVSVLDMLAEAHRLLVEAHDHLASAPDEFKVAGSLQSMLTMLALEISDPGAAKNYVELTMSWDGEIASRLPFRRVAVTFSAMAA